MDKLNEFGHTFQIKSISSLMKNQTFLEQIHDILDEKHYDNEGLKWIVKECKKYFDEYGIPSRNILTYRILDGDKSDNIGGVRGAGLKSLIKFLPQIAEDKDFTAKDLLEFAENSDSKIKLLENIKKGSNLIKRNYLLMQLQKVDIPKHTMRKIQNTVHGKIPQLIKYKFQTMFLKDKLSTQIKNLDSWIMEFTRLDRFRGLNK